MEFFAAMPATEYERKLALQPIRPLKPWERVVLVELASAAGLPDALITPAALDAYRVHEMLDSGMGSIRFVVGSESRTGDRFNVIERLYNDADGVLVSITLNLDDHGDPWEIDVGKTDFSPLKQPPSSAADLRAIQKPYVST
jgi:uncharacterized protein DUF6984